MIAAPVLSEPVPIAADSALVRALASPLSPVAIADTLTPRGALLRSAILPGWGQLRNGKPAKAVLFAGAAGGFLTAAILDIRSVRRAATPQEEEDRAARRNTRFLYFFIAATLSAVDAFVDTHLADFGDEPAMPGDREGAAQIRWRHTF